MSSDGNTIVLGDVTIHRIVEMQAQTDTFRFFPALTQAILDENRAWLEPDALDPATGKLILSMHSWVVRTKRHTILVDTCIGNDKQRTSSPEFHLKKTDTYMRGLKAAGFGVEDIDFVVCSHLHFDHVGWNTRLENGRWVPTFPRARYVFSQKEYDYWTGLHREKPNEALADSVLPIVEAKRADLVRNDHAVCEAVRLQPTPGHTPDHCAIRVATGGREAVFTGDLTHSPLQLRHPELGIRADFDRAQAIETRRRFFEEKLAADSLVCTMHYPGRSAGQLERWGTGFRFKQG
jgi:glyoxylase-like metal-dependent hydrolase (beta-lactamase superfamily II)